MLEILIVVSLAVLSRDSAARECGVMSSAASLVQNGHATQREAFPWIVNVFTRYEGATLYTGSGSLISDRHVLCAANSVAYENYLGDTLMLNPDQVRLSCACLKVKAPYYIIRRQEKKISFVKVCFFNDMRDYDLWNKENF